MQKFLLSFILFIFGIQLVGTWRGWYYTTNFDILMHILGGAWIAVLFFYLFAERWPVLELNRHRFAIFFFAIGFVALIGVGWEIFEYIVNVFVAGRTEFGCMQPGTLFDTLKDLFNDSVGGAAMSAYVLLRRRKGHSR